MQISISNKGTFMKKSGLLEFSFLSGIAGFSFAIVGILIGTVLFSLSVPLNQVFLHVFNHEPSHFEMGISVSIFVLFYFVASRVTTLAYMIIVLASLWYLVIKVHVIVWLAPAMLATIVICPLLVYYTKLITGKIEEH
jgi:hypothetical protein